MADVIAMYEIVADVITTEADVIAFYLWCWLMLLPIYIMWWQVLLPSGRCYSHCRVGDGTLADVFATGLMLLPWVIVLF